MRHRRLGRTGIEISEFTLGGGIVGGILIHPPEETRLAALERAVRAGCDWIDTAAHFAHHGITALGETPAILEVLRSGRFETAQVYHNMLNPSAARPVPPAWGGQDFGGVIEACRERDVGVMAIRVLAAGALATDERH